MSPDDPVELLQTALGHQFRDRVHLDRSLVHRSFCAEHPDAESNERMEFLGDAVLGLSVTNYVFTAYPDLPEGELAKLRASVVNAEVLASLGAEIELGAALLLGKGEDASGGRTKASILADAMEAVIAAVYLDGGWPAADALVLRLLGDRIREGAAGPGGHDYKTRLQELAARRFDQLPRYHVRAEGPDHSKEFFATVSIGGQVRGEGDGRSKKQAEQAAARAAWEHLDVDGLATADDRSGDDQAGGDTFVSSRAGTAPLAGVSDDA
jgi:ribonuclease-3